MKIIGLTGSIGMGKTYTAKMFTDKNIAVFDSDEAVHQLLGLNGAAVDVVEKEFPGVKIESQIDRKLLGKRVFADDIALKKLEQILHPMVSSMRDDFNKTALKNNADMIVVDIPLLFEKGYESECDYIVVASAPFEIQKQRVLERPGMSEQRFIEILKKQMPDDEKRRRADFIIQTDKGLDYAKNQVQQVIETIRKD